MLASTFQIMVAFVALRYRGGGRWIGSTLQAAILVFVVLTTLELGVGRITGEGFNAAVFYHLQTGLDGGDVSQYGWVMAVGFAAVLLVAGALWWAHKWFRPRPESRAPLWNGLVGLLALGALAAHPVILSSLSYALRFASVEQKFEGFTQPDLPSSGPSEPRNLVLIYLESIERTYLDQERFPGLTPYLSSFEDRAATFTNLGQTTGATFTVGGMVASQCGVPLILSGAGGNSMNVTRFLPGATCLGDIMSEAGYTLSYLGGASTKFAGKGAFLSNHGFDEVTGRDELLPLMDDPNYLTEWGLQDDTLLELAKSRFNRLSDSKKPFVLSVLTLDTHPPTGHAATNRSCAGLKYGDGSNPNLDAVMCDDLLVGRFIEEILSGPHAQNTVIAVLSDHLAMLNTATDQLNAGPRRNLFMVIDSETRATPQVLDRPATTLDIAPTLLSFLGFNVPKMGFGVDLLGGEQTVPEQLESSADDRSALDAFVLGFQSVYGRLWGFPDTSQGLYVNLERGEVWFGHSAFPVPSLLAMDSNFKITEISFGTDPAFNKSLTEIYADLPNGTPYFWFDGCKALEKLNTGTALGEADGFCFTSGRRNVNADTRAVSSTSYFSPEELDAMLRKNESGQEIDEAAALMEAGLWRGDIPAPVSIPGLKSGDRGVLVQSSAFGAGSSLVRRLTGETLQKGDDWVLGRGVSLVGIMADGAAEFIDRLDHCTPGFDGQSHRPWSDVINETRSRMIAHAIIVQDTAFCGTKYDPIAAPLEGLNLPVLRALGRREAYIGIIASDGQVQEFENPAFERVRLHILPRDPATTEQFAAAGVQNSTDTGGALPPFTETPVEAVGPPMALTTAAPEFADCLAPGEKVERVVTTPLESGLRLVGEQMTGAIGFGTGWWAQEKVGRWSGARVAEIALILPESGSGLRLDFQLASRDARAVSFAYNGAILGTASVQGETVIGLEMGSLPRGVPLELDISIDGAPLSCPAVEESSGDRRQLGIMLKTVTLRDSDGRIASGAAALGYTQAAVSVPAQPETRPDLVSVDGACSSPAVAAPEAFTLTSFPADKNLPISQAEADAVLWFGTGWWAPEVFGRWMGAGEAHLSLVLPAQPEMVVLSMVTSSFGADEIEAVLEYQGQEIGRQRTGRRRPFLVDVSALPRGVPLDFILRLPSGKLGCPKSRGVGDDTRSLGLMLHALSLESRVIAPFTSAIGVGGGRLDGVPQTNSFDALAVNLRRFDVFELDFEWTSDFELVCIKDWGPSYRSRFGEAALAKPRLADFHRQLAASKERPRNCDLDGLAGWLRANPSVRIVASAKVDGLKVLEQIAERHPDILAQFVPQTFIPGDIGYYRSLGYPAVIWAIQEGIDAPNAPMIVDGLHEFAPDALAITVDMALTGLMDAIVEGTAIPVYVGTVNSLALAACLVERGAAGIFSDDLGRDEIDALNMAEDNCVPKETL